MRKTFGALVVLTAVGLALPGSASAQTKIVIGIPTSPPNIVHMPPIVAKELGLYKRPASTRRSYRLATVRRSFRALLAENIDFGVDTRRAYDHRPLQVAPTVKALSRESAEIRSLDDCARRNQDDGRSERQAHRHPGAWRFRRHFEPAAYCAQQRSIRRKSTSWRSQARTFRRSSPIRSTPQFCMSNRKCWPKSKVPDLHAIGRMWELQPKTLYTFLAANEKTIKEKPEIVQAVVSSQYRSYPDRSTRTGQK